LGINRGDSRFQQGDGTISGLRRFFPDGSALRLTLLRA
jgi:hypothetical protein